MGVNMNNVNEYRTIIEKFARERVNQRVSNGMAVHASVLLETMFKHATAEMRIFTGELNHVVFAQDSLIAAAKQFLMKPYASLRILVQKDQGIEWAQKHPLVSSLSEMNAPHGHYELRFASGSYALDTANHFAVMDNDGYRFELDHGDCRAVANFNEPRVAIDLMKAFDKAFSLGKSSTVERKSA